MEALPPATPTADLTPPPPHLHFGDTHLTHYRTTDTMKITPERGDTFWFVLNHLEANNDLLMSKTHKDVIKTTPEKRQMEIAARAFVCQTIGVEPSAPIYWKSHFDNSNQRGVHDSIFNAIYVAEYESPDEPRKYMEEMSTLVHELAHATGDERRATVLHTIVEDTDNTYTGYHLGMSVLKIAQRSETNVFDIRGNFVEESFAEETAARWREQLTPALYAHRNNLLETDYGPLPVRFFDHDYIKANSGEDTPFGAKVPAYAAHTLTLLSEASQTDLYDLMVQIRQSKDPAPLKRTFITAVDSIQRGLYQRLRNAPYTPEGFGEAYQHVQKLLASRQTGDTVA